MMRRPVVRSLWSAVACGVASAWLVACAASPSSVAPASSSGASSGGMETSASGAPAAAGMPSSGGADTTGSAVPPSANSPRPMSVAPSNGSGGGTAGRSISDWQAEIDQDMRQLQSGGECRDVCRASGGICSAAREICSLTGDAEGAPPSDGRCARARSACEQATRQRNGACPVCPTER